MAEDNLAQLQLLQQNLQHLMMQKQQFQKELMEIDSALKELENSSNAYKIVGNLMINAKKEELQKELQEKKETFDLRLKNLEKQEVLLKKKTEEFQQKTLEEIKKKK